MDVREPWPRDHTLDIRAAVLASERVMQRLLVRISRGKVRVSAF